MIIQVVRTPADFERTLEADLCRINHWVLAPAAASSAALEGIIGRAFDERGPAEETGGHPAPEAVAGPLARLQAQGFQLVALLTRALCALPPGCVRTGRRERPVDMADYLVAPDPCYFRLCDGRFTDPIHRLGSECLSGHASIVGGLPEKREKTFEIWTSLEAVLRDFEWSVPWCQRCEPEGPGSRS